MKPRLKPWMIVLIFVIISAALVGACGRKGDPVPPPAEETQDKPAG